MKRRAALVLIFVTGCSAPAGSQQERFVPNRPVTDIMYDTATGTVEGAWQAVQTPLVDLNLKRQPIPEKLQKITDNPYAVPSPLLCDSIRREIAELDTLLGPDVCTPQNPAGTASRKGAYVDQGSNMAKQRAIDEVSGKVNVIPFRSMVRYASGAEKHAREVDRAYQAGKLRRAFLKGLEASLGPECINRSMSNSIVSARIPAPPPSR